METKAWQFSEIGGPEGLTLVGDRLADPGPGEALVALRAIGLNRAELLYLAGRYIYQPPVPSFLGQEGVGEVIAVGPAIDGGAPAPAVGSRVALLAGRLDIGGMGAFRTAGLYSNEALLPVPESLSDAEGAALWINALTAVGGLQAGGVTAAGADGRKVLVTAASSGVGVTALQTAGAWGAETVAVTTSPGKRESLRELADHVVLADQMEEAIAELYGGSGVDLAFDPVGFANAEVLTRIASIDGGVVFYGIMAGSEASLDLVSMLRKDLGLHGFTIYRLLRRTELLAAAVAEIDALVASGELKPIVAATFPFDQAPQALAELAKNAHLGKIVVEVGSTS